MTFTLACRGQLIRVRYVSLATLFSLAATSGGEEMKQPIPPLRHKRSVDVRRETCQIVSLLSSDLQSFLRVHSFQFKSVKPTVNFQPYLLAAIQLDTKRVSITFLSTSGTSRFVSTKSTTGAVFFFLPASSQLLFHGCPESQ